MNRIFVTGDVHGEMDRKKINNKNFWVHKELTKDDYMILLGDVAIRWYDTLPDGNLVKSDKSRIDFMQNRSYTVLFIDGNHENHNALDEYPVTMWHGGKVHQISDTVYHLMRGQVFEIGGKTFFTMGGATSSDKIFRKENVSWWKREMPSDKEYHEAWENLKKVGFKVDYILSHCCPSRLLRFMINNHKLPDKLTDFFEEIDKMTKYQQWYFGHLHTEKRFDDRKHTCVYNHVLELKDGYDLTPVNEKIIAEKDRIQKKLIASFLKRMAASKGIVLSDEELKADIEARYKKTTEESYKHYYEER